MGYDFWRILVAQKVTGGVDPIAARYFLRRIPTYTRSHGQVVDVCGVLLILAANGALRGYCGEYLDSLGTEVIVLREREELRKSLLSMRAAVVLIDTTSYTDDTDEQNLLETIRILREIDERHFLMARGAPLRGLDSVLLREAGLDDYLLTDEEPMLVEAKLRRVLRRQWACATCPNTAPRHSLVRELTPHVACCLTRTEERLWLLLRNQAGKIVSPAALAEAVWGRADVETKLLYGHLSMLRNKLAASGWRIRNMRNLGYMLERCAEDGRRGAGR